MATLLAEDFNRVVVNNWTGGPAAWTLSGGTVPDDYDITGTKGTHTHPVANVLHHATVNAGVPDQRVRTVVNLSAAVLTGGSATTWVLARFTDVNNYYVARLDAATSGAVTLTLFKRTAGTLSAALASAVAVGTFANLSTTNVGVEFYVRGTTLSAKAWDTAGAEPAAYQTVVTDTSLTTGNLAGLATRREAANTNVSLAWAFDLFTVATLALTVTEQDVYPPRVLLTVTDLIIGDAVELFRVVSGIRAPVRAGADPAVGDVAFLAIDAELPFGVPVSYVVVVGAVEVATGPVTYVLTGGKVAVTDAITGLAAEVVIGTWPEKTYDPRASIFQAGGRNIVLSSGLGMPRSEVELITETTASAENLREVLRGATQGIVQVRQPGGYDEVDGYLAITGYTSRRWAQDGSDQKRRHILAVAEVEGWAPALAARGYTYQDLLDLYTGLTYADVAADFATYLALAQADLS